VINRNFFFDRARIELFSGSFKKAQLDGLTAILDRWEASHADQDDRWLAYMLATAHHETDRTMQPITEYGGPKYFTRKYDVTGERPALAKKMGNTTPGDGPRYCGRGYVQLTWKVNYQKAKDKLGPDFVGTPTLALDARNASDIMFLGMAEGWFTTKTLADYFNTTKEDWINARRIINGTDKANLIAEYGKKYYSLISYKK
jgi:putative chitinase